MSARPLPVEARAESLDIRVPAFFRLVQPADFEGLVPSLVELFREAVNGGATMGFLPPLSEDVSRDYWLSLRQELRTGTRLLIAAWLEGALVGSGQLVLSPWPNAPHRAEIQKVFVAGAHRGRGVGGALLAALHELARRRGRSLVHLSTRQGEPAETFYRRLGYRTAGVLPGWTVGPDGDRRTLVTLYREP
jgi:GNAT superfamily N-acetyltransferase